MQKSKGGMRRHGYSLTPLLLFSFEERMGVCLIFSHCPLNHTVIITLFTRERITAEADEKVRFAPP